MTSPAVESAGPSGAGRVHPPDPERVAQSTLTRYASWLEAERGVAFADYAALWRWSVDDLEAFWRSIWDFCDALADESPEPVLASRAMPGTEWFPNVRLNYAENVFARGDPAAVAIHHASETRPSGTWTWGELRAEAARLAAGLRADGVGPGTRVVAYLPNVPETVAALMACASLGAVWSACSPDFGVASVIDRFAQVEPTVLLAVDGYRYGGRDFDRRATVAELQARLPSLERTVLLDQLTPGAELGELRDAVRWADYGDPGAELTFARLPFDHPLWVLYSSGTTGLPKPIVQGQGGMLLEQAKFSHLQLDARAGDRVFWFTTTGWMMWNLLVGVLLTDAEIVLFDGNPGHPDLGRLWDLAEATGITTFGTSAAYLAACQKAAVRPREGRRLSSLRAVGSTGSPLSPEGFAWVYDHLGEDVWLFSTSGGTDVCTAFVGGVPSLPVVEGELQARALGAAIEAWDERGRPVAAGEVGELVLTAPLPSMPLFFWGDGDGTRLRESYFDTYPGVWRHGDWIELTRGGGAVIHGRSDATINRGGIRMGTSEIYRAVLSHDAVTDALVVDVPVGGTDGVMVLFVVLRAGEGLDDALVGDLGRRIRSQCSPRHVPDEVHRAPLVPRTLSGKLLELPIKRLLSGQSLTGVTRRDDLADPAALDWFEAFADGWRGAAGAASPA